MLKCVMLMLFLLVPSAVLADIYQHVDEEDVVHLTDAPDGPGWVPFAQEQEKAPAGKPATKVSKKPAPVPGKYIFKDVSATDGAVYAVKQTNLPGVYYWYMGFAGDYVARYKKGAISLDGGPTVSVQNSEVVATDGVTRAVWLDGTLGYGMYMATVEHATSR